MHTVKKPGPSPERLSMNGQLINRSHDTHVDNFEVVATQHNGDNVLADVVHITLDEKCKHFTLFKNVRFGANLR